MIKWRKEVYFLC